MVLAALTVVVVWYLTEQQACRLYVQSQRDEVGAELDKIRARLEINLVSDLYLAQGLATAISIEPDMSQTRFSQLASQLFKESKNLRNVAAAPDLVVSLIHPLKGNESILGLNYKEIPQQYDDVLKAKSTGRLVLAGPLTLIQGGRAFIGRYPIYNTTLPEKPFWGIVAAVIDLDRLYSSSGLYDPYTNISISLENNGSKDEDKIQFFGTELTTLNDPVSQIVRLPTGDWTISAMPLAGWEMEFPARWYLRLGFCIAAALIIIPLLSSSFLLRQRHKYIEGLSQQKSKLVLQSRRLHLAMEASDAAVWEYDMDNKTVSWDAKMSVLHGYSSAPRKRPISEWSLKIHPEDRARALREFDDCCRNRTRYSSVYRIVLPNGAVRHHRSLANTHSFRTSNKVIGVNWDVTEETDLQTSLESANINLKEKNEEIEAARQRVEFLAYHDFLTELPNRRFLDRQLSTHIRDYSDGNAFAAVLQIDLDGFKNINDTLGHFAGDQVLKQVGSILRELVDEQDYVVRLGGDEFVILLTRPDRDYFISKEYLQQLAGNIIEVLARPLLLTTGSTKISASIGISTDAISTTTPQDLLRDADVALYEAKASGRSQYKICDSELRRIHDQKSQFLSEIETALKDGQIVPYYQPQYSGKDLSITGVEALARWDHPTRGLLTPIDFLDGAKEIGKDAEIDRAILKRVLIDRENWQNLGADVPKISVNVSAQQISTPTILDDLAAMNIPRGALCFELLETIFMDDNNQFLQDIVEGIKELGIDIEIDDFGTGFASIVALQKLSPMRLKIDNQLVSPITKSDSARNILGSLIEIGKALDIEVIAEGVESTEHIDALIALGCDALQGYALCHPLSGDCFAELIHQGAPLVSEKRSG